MEREETLGIDEARIAEGQYRAQCRGQVEELIRDLMDCLDHDKDGTSFRLSGNPALVLRQAFDYHSKAEALRNVVQVLTYRQEMYGGE